MLGLELCRACHCNFVGDLYFNLNDVISISLKKTYRLLAATGSGGWPPTPATIDSCLLPATLRATDVVFSG
jgi:hypothetical protein